MAFGAQILMSQSSLFRVSIAKRSYDPGSRYTAAIKKRVTQSQRTRAVLMGHNLFAIGKMNVTRLQLVTFRTQITELIDSGVVLLQDLGQPGAPVVTPESVLGPLRETVPVPEDTVVLAVDSPANDVPPEKGTLHLVEEIVVEDVIADEDDSSELDDAASSAGEGEKEDLHALLLEVKLSRKALWVICDLFEPSLSKKSRMTEALDGVLEALDAGLPHDHTAILNVIQEG